MSATQTDFYVTGGTLQTNAPSYVARRADEELFEGLWQGQFCYVLTSRQMGKSSLMVRTAKRLREGGVAVVILDLTAIGQNVSVEQWYDGLLARVGQQLDLEDELEDFWFKSERLGPLQRWMQGLRKIVLERSSGRVVIFIDEIDAVRSLPFSTDEFFAGIRELYNRRTVDAELQRLTFCLLGVATPSDLIRDTRMTPFNIGRRVELTDFAGDEVEPLAEGLGRNGDGKALLERILHWTGGHPYLTQRLCKAVAEERGGGGKRAVDRKCEEIFLSQRARERDDNLIFVRERMLRSEVDKSGLLDLYLRAWERKPVSDDETNPLVSVLRLSGITRSASGLLHVRNRIYRHVFDRAWVKENMPGAEVRRQRAAYQRGFLRAVAIFLLVWIVPALAMLPGSDDGRSAVTGLENVALDSLFWMRHMLRPELAERGRVEPITIIEVDETSIRQSGVRFEKWPRTFYARLIDRAREGGAKVVGLYVYLSEAGGLSAEYKAADERLAASLYNTENVVIVQKLKAGDAEAIYPLPMFEESAAVGFADLPFDSDNSVRSAMLVRDVQGKEPQFSFAAALAQFYTGDELRPGGPDSFRLGNRVIPLRNDTALQIDFRGSPPSFTRVSAVDILCEDFKQLSAPGIQCDPSRQPSDELFRDRVVLIGATNNDAPDLFVTPFYKPGPVATLLSNLFGRRLDAQPKRMPGVEVHANALATILFGDAPVRLSYLRQVLAFSVPLLLSALAIFWRRHLLGLLAALLVMLITFAVYVWLFNAYALILPLASMLIGTGALTVIGFILWVSSKLRISINTRKAEA